MAGPNVESPILRVLGARCRDDARRALIVDNPALSLNGIDYVELHSPLELDVHFLLPLPVGAYGLLGTGARAIRIDGGTRVVGVKALSSTLIAPRALRVNVDRQGDFSPYWLAIGWHLTGGAWRFALNGIDRQFSIAPVDFRPGCEIDVDCAPASTAVAERLPEPVLDYLAKDYASFRALLLDLVAQRFPAWVERNPADLGIALLELLAYEADAISYFQDAAANEATLHTARKRISAKRHARLIDYAMHDGRNAWTYAHFAVASAGTVPARTRLLTRLTAVPQHFHAIPGTIVNPAVPVHLGDPTSIDPQALLDDTAFASTRVYETTAELKADPANDTIVLHTWGNEVCCLESGSTTAHGFVLPAAAAGTIVRPKLVPGDLLLLEEVRSPVTGLQADADAQRRTVVRVEHVDDMVLDHVFDETTGPDNELQPFRTGVAGAKPLPLSEITWRAQDALPFELCLSALTADGSPVRRCAVARGNLVVADHGLTLVQTTALDTPVEQDEPFRLRLERAPVTMTAPPELGPHNARAAVALTVDGASWDAVPALLEADEFATGFVVDVDDDGGAVLRFGDDDYGRSVTGASAFVATYRAGHADGGTIGAESLAHVVRDTGAPPLPAIAAVRNPLPSSGAAARETIEQVRAYAPAAFHAKQFRAVTTRDYVDAARSAPGVADAVATFRWTGSWYTALLGIEPADPHDLVTLDGGRTFLRPEFSDAVRAFVGTYKLAGYDLELRAARYVPLRIELRVCVAPNAFRIDVGQAVLRALGPEGLFAYGNFRFGTPLYLSRVYAAAQAVPGVDSVDVRVFRRNAQDPSGELEAGVIAAGPWEILRLDNDRNRLENGVIVVDAEDGI